MLLNPSWHRANATNHRFGEKIIAYLQKARCFLATDKEITGSKPTFFVSYPVENAIIPASRPLINGGGIPGNDVFVFINSKPQFAFRTTIDKNGKWRVLPDTPMGAGTYIASVTSKDEREENYCTAEFLPLPKVVNRSWGLQRVNPLLYQPLLLPQPYLPPQP